MVGGGCGGVGRARRAHPRRASPAGLAAPGPAPAALPRWLSGPTSRCLRVVRLQDRKRVSRDQAVVLLQLKVQAFSGRLGSRSLRSGQGWRSVQRFLKTRSSLACLAVPGHAVCRSLRKGRCCRQDVCEVPVRAWDARLRSPVRRLNASRTDTAS